MAVTEYEKEEYTEQCEFEYTVYDKVPFTVTIDEPYVTKNKASYTATVPVPYEVVGVEEQVIYELEDYTVDKQVPFIVEDLVTVTEIQQEAYLAEKSDKKKSHVTHQQQDLAGYPSTVGDDEVNSHPVEVTAG